jgi:hypothetical protein
MEELTARLEMVFWHYVAARKPGLDDAALQEIENQFCAAIMMLIAEHGHAAVRTAMDAMPSERWPSMAAH